MVMFKLMVHESDVLISSPTLLSPFLEEKGVKYTVNLLLEFLVCKICEKSSCVPGPFYRKVSSFLPSLSKVSSSSIYLTQSKEK